MAVDHLDTYHNWYNDFMKLNERAIRRALKARERHLMKDFTTLLNKDYRSLMFLDHLDDGIRNFPDEAKFQLDLILNTKEVYASDLAYLFLNALRDRYNLPNTDSVTRVGIELRHYEGKRNQMLKAIGTFILNKINNNMSEKI